MRVSGRGIATASAAQCLVARGIDISADAGGLAQRQAPVVMLGEAARELLNDVFAGHDTLAGAHRIARRVVGWGGDAPQTFDHAAWVIAGDRLSDRLPWPADLTEQTTPFTLTTALPGDARLMRFGAREAMALPVELTPTADRAAALVEALGAGWLFLIPTGGNAGWLLVVGAEPGDALHESRLVAPSIAATGAVSSRFETAPRVLDNPAASGCLTLGSGALAFDPICGDGTATAVRGGILAAATAAALAGHDQGLDGEAVCAHYRAMMIAAMRRHLGMSWPFYARGGDSAWWRDEAAALAEGHDWCTRQLAEAGEARFMLTGDRLTARTLGENLANGASLSAMHPAQIGGVTA